MSMVSLCVCLVKAHRLICNMTYFDLFGSPRDLDLRSNFPLDLSRSPCICFDASRREKHDGVKIIPLSFFVQKVFAKNKVFRSWPQKATLFSLSRPGRSRVDLNR